MNAIDEVIELSNYLRGFADAQQNEKLHKASKYLKTLSREICGQGFICNGGKNCAGDHK